MGSKFFVRSVLTEYDTPIQVNVRGVTNIKRKQTPLVCLTENRRSSLVTPAMCSRLTSRGENNDSLIYKHHDVMQNII